MKTRQSLRILFLATIFGFAVMSVFASNDNRKQAQTDTLSYIEYRGKVVDASTGEVLPFATVEAEGTNITTVTNIDGEFRLKIGKNFKV